MSNKYLFTSERLGFRNWVTADIAIMAEINADAAVMEFFPGIQSQRQTEAFVDRMQKSLPGQRLFDLFCRPDTLGKWGIL